MMLAKYRDTNGRSDKDELQFNEGAEGKEHPGSLILEHIVICSESESRSLGDHTGQESRTH
jgi:hypothetical protein